MGIVEGCPAYIDEENKILNPQWQRAMVNANKGFIPAIKKNKVDVTIVKEIIKGSVKKKRGRPKK